MTGYPILEAAWATRVCGHVSSDAAILQARRVGRIKELLRPHRRLQLAGDHPRLDDRDRVREMDFLDLLHPLERERNPAAHRHATADITVAGAARGHRDFVFRRELHHAAHLLSRAGKNHDVRIVFSEPLIATVRPPRRLVGGDAIGAEE